MKGSALRYLAVGFALALGATHIEAQADEARYLNMAKLDQYLMSDRSAEIVLARSAAPASIADHADVLVLGAHGYETAAKGTNGFVCYVGRSWDLAFADPEFWNPRIRSPQCVNPASFRTVLPRYLERTEWVLAGVDRTEMKSRETAERTAGKLTAPEPGAMSFMMSKGGYLNDGTGGPWNPHVMFFAPRADGSQWGAAMAGSPVHADSVNYEQTTIIVVVVPKWSDGTLGPAVDKH